MFVLAGAMKAGCARASFDVDGYGYTQDYRESRCQTRLVSACSPPASHSEDRLYLSSGFRLIEHRQQREEP